MISRLLGIFQYVSLETTYTANFVIMENRYEPDDMHILESYQIRHHEFSSFKNKDKFLELKSHLKESSGVRQERGNLLWDVEFLEQNAVTCWLVINVVKVQDEKGEEGKKFKTVIDVSFQNFVKIGSVSTTQKYSVKLQEIIKSLYQK